MATKLAICFLQRWYSVNKASEIKKLLESEVKKEVSSVKLKKRFVAGAKCPKCQAQDSIVLFKEQGIETIECVECDYREQQTEQQVAVKAGGEVIGVFKP